MGGLGEDASGAPRLRGPAGDAAEAGDVGEAEQVGAHRAAARLRRFGGV